MRGILAGIFGGTLLLFAGPSSSNYNLKSYDFGNGGTEDSSSTNYNVDGTAGAQSGDKATSTNFSVKSGENPTRTKAKYQLNCNEEILKFSESA